MRGRRIKIRTARDDSCLLLLILMPPWGFVMFVAFRVISLPLLSLALAFLLSGCSALGVAAGTGAAVGIAAAQEGGVRGAANDLRIKAQISDLWFNYDLKTFAKLHLTVDQGRVLVTGIVPNPDDRVEAIRLVWQVEGVAQVINEVRVAEGSGLPGYLRDQWISTRLRTALTFDRGVQSINYSIDTVDGVVYLMGAAQNQTELNRVIEIARTISYVKQVISYVKMVGEPAVAAAQDYQAPQQETISAAQDSAPEATDDDGWFRP